MIYITVDIGGTNTRLALSTSLKKPSFRVAPIRHRNAHDYAEDLAFIIDSARILASGIPIDAVGIGIPGSLSESKLELKSVRYLSQWIDKPFVTTLSSTLGCPVFAENDGVAAGLGEAYYGDTPNTFCYVIWGTGIGGSVVQRNGHSSTVEVIKLDHATHFKAWENDCGGRELEKRLGKRPEALSDGEWLSVMARFSSHLERFIEITEATAVVFGGGLALRHRETILGLQQSQTSVGVTKLGKDSGLYGGIGVIRQNRPLSEVNEFFHFKDASLERIRPSEIKVTVDLVNDAYSYQDKYRDEPRTNVQHLSEKIAESKFYVVKQHDQIVGCVYVERHAESVHFGLLTVIGQLRGTGLGTAILQAIEQYARSQDVKNLELDYMSVAPWLKPYYERYGFAETGQEVGWGKVGLIRMSKLL